MSERTQPRRIGIWIGAAAAVALVAAAVFGALMWNGGAAMPNKDELLAEADHAKAELRQKAYEVAVLIDPDAPQEAPAYFADEEPQRFSEDLKLGACGDGYAYTLNRTIGNADGWRFPKDQEVWRQEIGTQLHEAGWTDITGASFDGDTGTTVVYARFPGVVKELKILFHPGDVADGISIDAEGLCQPGNYTELSDLLFERASG